MPLFLAIDPGKRKVGWAIYDPSLDSPIESAGTWHGAGYTEGVRFILGHKLPVVAELPTVYSSRLEAAEDVRDLIAFVKSLKPVRSYPPGRWKGNVPKDIHHSRFMKAVPEDKRPPLSEHDAWDAIGIALFDVVNWKLLEDLLIEGPYVSR
jgi:hypothetical protein